MGFSCENLQRDLGALFRCAVHSVYIRISTPFLYPNGRRVNLFVREQGGAHQITDLGETTRWLSIGAPSGSSLFTEREQGELDRVCRNRGVMYQAGHLVSSVENLEQVPDALIRLIQACLQIADISYLFSQRREMTSER